MTQEKLLPVRELCLQSGTIPNWYRSFFRAQSWARKFDVSAPLRSAQAEVPRTSCAVSRLILNVKIVQIRLK